MKFIANNAKYDTVLYTNESAFNAHVWDCERTIVFSARGYPDLKNASAHGCPKISLIEDDNLYAWHSAWHTQFEYNFYNYRKVYYLDQGISTMR